MKKLGIIGLAAAVWVGGPSVPARAGSDGWAAFGGFLGGLILSDYSSRSSHTVYIDRSPIVERTVVVREPYREVVVYEPYREVVVYEPYREVIIHRPAPVYEVRSTQVWIPGGYRYEVGRSGHSIRSYSPGYYHSYHPKVRVESHSYRRYGGYNHYPSYRRHY